EGEEKDEKEADGERGPEPRESRRSTPPSSMMSDLEE
ncbi:hypothetical protein ADUPG1_014523, partial [Aduncisulcus paluster]